MSENKEFKQIINQLLENHHTAVSTIAHEFAIHLLLCHLLFKLWKYSIRK